VVQCRGVANHGDAPIQTGSKAFFIAPSVPLSFEAGLTRKGQLLSMSKLIIEEPPLQVLPSLALVIGLHEAIILQQLHYLLRDPRFGRRIEEKQWIFNTAEDWRWQYFPFWTEKIIRKAMANLSRLNLIETIQPEGRVSRRKYYRIRTEELERLAEVAQMETSKLPKREDGKWTKREVPLKTKTSSETSPKNTKGAFAKHRLFFGEKKPLHPYPTSEEAMNETLEHHGIEPNPDYDGNFFAVMQKSGWLIRGKPVHDWIATYAARLAKTSP
jgi:DNA-binding PadR family transcriptional regulator